MRGLQKYERNLISDDGFLSYLQDRTANPAHLTALLCPVLVCPQRLIV